MRCTAHCARTPSPASALQRARSCGGAGRPGSGGRRRTRAARHARSGPAAAPRSAPLPRATRIRPPGGSAGWVSRVGGSASHCSAPVGATGAAEAAVRGAHRASNRRAGTGGLTGAEGQARGAGRPMHPAHLRCRPPELDVRSRSRRRPPQCSARRFFAPAAPKYTGRQALNSKLQPTPMRHSCARGWACLKGDLAAAGKIGAQPDGGEMPPAQLLAHKIALVVRLAHRYGMVSTCASREANPYYT